MGSVGLDCLRAGHGWNRVGRFSFMRLPVELPGTSDHVICVPLLPDDHRELT